MNSEMLLWRNIISQPPRRHRRRLRGLTARSLWRRLTALLEVRRPRTLGGGPA